MCGKERRNERQQNHRPVQPLSQDDQLSGESNSIKNQKKQLEEYAKTHGFKNIVHAHTRNSDSCLHRKRHNANILLSDIQPYRR